MTEEKYGQKEIRESYGKAEKGLRVVKLPPIPQEELDRINEKQNTEAHEAIEELRRGREKGLIEALRNPTLIRV